MPGSTQSLCSRSYFRGVISGKEEGFVASAYRSGLAAASLVYTAGVRLHQKYSASVSRGFAVSVVSVGNITVGGTGKTPAVISLAREYLRSGKRVAVLSRGYRRQIEASAGPLVVADGEQVLSGPTEAGDEPVLIAEKAPGCVVIVGADRRESADLAIQKFGVEVLLLDDGFQHLKIHRDRDIVLIDALNPFGFGRVLPRGLLREPLEGLCRANVLVLTRSDQISEENAAEIVEKLRRLAPNARILKAIHLPVNLLNPADSAQSPPDTLRGKTVCCFSGIANPASFFHTVKGLGAEVGAELVFPDHHWYAEKDLDLIAKRSGGCEAVITTEKDWIRLRELHRDQFPLRVLEVDFRIVEGGWPDDLLGVSQD